MKIVKINCSHLIDLNYIELIFQTDIKIYFKTMVPISNF